MPTAEPTCLPSSARPRTRVIRLRPGAEAMRDRALITTGAVGGALAAICGATPLLAVVLGAMGLTAWLAKADYVLIPALIVCLRLIVVRLVRRRDRQGAR